MSLIPRLQQLPGFSDELKPVDLLWNWVERSELGNTASADSTELHKHLLPLLKTTSRDLRQLNSFWTGAKLLLHKQKESQ